MCTYSTYAHASKSRFPLYCACTFLMKVGCYSLEIVSPKYCRFCSQQLDFKVDRRQKLEDCSFESWKSEWPQWATVLKVVLFGVQCIAFIATLMFGKVLRHHADDCICDHQTSNFQLPTSSFQLPTSMPCSHSYPHIALQ